MVASALEPRRLTPAAQLDCVLLSVAVGNRVVRRVWHLLERRVALALRGRELLFGLPQLFLDVFQLLDLLGRRLALQLLARAQLVDSRHELAPALVRREPRVERVRRALARERSPVSVGVVARSFRVDQAAARATASASGRRPSRRAAASAATCRWWASRFDSPIRCTRQ